ncbi:MAG: MFS transporter [bacterium]|nr:MFS transporter [bacterium]
MDKTRKYEIKATIAISASNYLEAGAIVAGAGGLTLWVKYLHLTSIWVGLLGAVSANGFGAAIGAILSGHLIDRFGRKFIYKYDLLLYMFGMILIIFANSFPILLAGYIIVGIAVGALIPAAWTYIAEEAPPEKRAARVGWTQFAWSLGPAVVLFLCVALAPLGLLGNRIIFAQLFIVAVITWVLQQQICESKIWEEEKRKEKNKKGKQKSFSLKASMIELFTVKANIKAFIFLIGIYFFWNLVAGTMGYFMTYIYVKVGGLSNMQGNLLNGSMWVIIVLSTYFFFIKIGDRVNRKLLFGIGGLLAIISWFILTFGGMSMTSLYLFIVIWGVSAGFSAQAFYALFANELFHTKYRAHAQGVMFCIVRAGVGVISLGVPFIIFQFGFKVTGVVLIVFLFISFLIGVIMIPNTRGRSLRAIEKERYGEGYSEKLK